MAILKTANTKGKYKSKFEHIEIYLGRWTICFGALLDLSLRWQFSVYQNLHGLEEEKLVSVAVKKEERKCLLYLQ